jgi:hypothetical protein
MSGNDSAKVRRNIDELTSLKIHRMVFVPFPVLPVCKQVTLTLSRVEAAIANITHDGHMSLTDRYNSFEIQDGLRLPANAVGLAVCHTPPHRGVSRRRCCFVFGTM